ncbi:tetratricopeptide repeat protein [Ferribacterium limneticum]|uniref:tetratricopeptide repeat protein n=1 Tax=Ferribacterium limneticum TaxID=76259 RepID=UPI001CFA3BA3|nr:tetratricopeptide repeat protein [Ferribacterium limneticum]UCV17964.1 tetratricopeptide repeat protein [Ferribacterium limneticum]
MSKGITRQSAAAAGRSAMPGNLQFILDQGISLLQQGQLAPAEVYFRQVLTAVPQHLDALQFLGVIEYQKGRFAAAAELLQSAIDLAPDAPGLHCNLGLAQQELGHPEQALASYDRALALTPKFVEALNNRGNVLRQLGRLAESAASYRRALSSRPDFIEALFNLGITQIAQGQADQAVTPLARCLRLAPGHLGAWGQYGVALMALNKHADALNCFERILSHTANDAEAHYWRGNALLALGRPDEALQAYGNAAQIRPDIPEVHYNIGNVLLDQGRVEEGIAAFNQALDRRPAFPEALYNRGGAEQDLGRYDDAAATYEHLLTLVPDHRYALGRLFHCRQFGANWRRHAEQRSALVASADGVVRDMPFPFLAVSDDPALQLRCAQAYTAAKYPPAATPLCSGKPYAHQRIRLAYVSADFCEHALSYLLAGVFETHDRALFEVWGISLKPGDGSAMAGRVATAFEHFIDASALNDNEVARQLRDLEIDIAIDLTGHTQDARTAIFAARPAPVQVNYLGFPGSMGAAYIDYIIADDFVIPEAARPHYAEQVVHLPECFQGNDDRRAIDTQPQTRAAHGLPEKAFVFCAFNNTYKLTPEFFDLWMRLLAAVPDSVLWLASADASVQRNLRAEAERRGIAPERLVFSPRIRYAEHLARLQLADLFLDTLPFNAGTTASDALWAGVPVLTCAGRAFSARMAGSLLRALGLPELITGSLAAYEARALELAANPAVLSALRSRLANNRATHPLFDTRRFTRHLEQAYLAMQQRVDAGLPPDHLVIAAELSAA